MAAGAPPATADLDLARRIFASAPFMRDLGVEPIAVEAGRITTELVVAERHLQHTGYVHAGVMASLADHSMGAAAQTLAPAQHWVLTAELKTSQLRAARGLRLVCVAWVIKSGRNISFAEAEVFTEDAAQARTLVMKASATMAVTAPRG